MDSVTEEKDPKRFADGETPSDLQSDPGGREFGDGLDGAGSRKRADSQDRLEAYKPGPADDASVSFKDSARRSDNPLGGGSRWARRITGRTVLVALLVLAVGALAPFAWNYLQSYESTDDAQIDGHVDPISSRINGTVVGVYAENDFRVRKGELLVEIDPRDYEVAVERARANLELARAQLASAKQNYGAALAKVREDLAANFRAQRDAHRYTVLLHKGVVPQEQYDQFIATARVDFATVDYDQEEADSARKAIAARKASVDGAKAALHQTLLNLSYTKIYAPANGIVGKRSVQLGSRIQPGQTLMFVTETDDIWVTADFKETQLARMHRGEKVTIHVDTFGRDYKGYVADMPGAAGDLFSLLPPENATGNYVKVVQRLSVRIRFDRGQDLRRLHPGMSVEPTVWLR